jgi:hypothetical protein
VLLAEGIVEVSPASDGSVYQEYVITKKGRALLPTLVALAQWSSEHLFDRREVRFVPIDAKGGRKADICPGWRCELYAHTRPKLVMHVSGTFSAN